MFEQQLSQNVLAVAERIRSLRELLDIPAEEMADVTGLPLEAYLACEEGRNDFSFTFLFKCANRFGVDISELVLGDTPKLSLYTVVRKGEGMPIERRKGFNYGHLAYLFRNRLTEPFIVRAKYSKVEQDQPIVMSTHRGQEFDYILRGALRFQIENHVELLHEGDCIYYDSSRRHGMIADLGEDCEFLAIVIPEEETKEEK